MTEEEEMQELIDWAESLRSTLVVSVSGGPVVTITNCMMDPTNCPPASPDMGDVWMDWDADKCQFTVKVWDGTGWDDLSFDQFSDPFGLEDISDTGLELVEEPEETPEQAYDRAMGVLK